jgi:antitoxin component YwqK of YwqJK toxin-antitoxin module
MRPFALTVMLLAGWAAFAQPAGYYRSDAIGLALEPVPGFSRQEPFLLRVRRDGELETRTLYKEGKELRRWELSPKLERIFEAGSLSEERSFDGAGRITVEKIFAEGKISETAQYRYGLSGLAAVETNGPDGTLLRRESFDLGPGGELRRVRRETPGRTEAEEVAMVSADGRLFEERLAGGGRRLVNRYGAEGRVASQETWQERELLETRELAYAGKLPLSTEWTIAGTRTVTRYDAEGREASRQASRGGKVLEEWTFRYDAKGNRVQAVRIDDRGTEQWSYLYDAASALQREEYRLRGLLQKVVRYTEGGRVEELYRTGLPFLVVTYRGAVKVREEFLEGGQVVRTREFEAGP